MNKKELSGKMCGRILDSVLTYSSISNLVYEGLDFGFDCIQVFPNMLPKVREFLGDKKFEVCAVIAYPHGVFTGEQKAFEIEDAIKQGATQVEVVINNLNVRSGKWENVRQEMMACRQSAGDAILKYILEVEFLTDEQIQTASKIAMEEKIDRLVTSVGVYNKLDGNNQEILIKVSVDDVKKIKTVVGNNVKVVAQGGIDSFEFTKTLLSSGADYISSEFSSSILRQCNL